MSQGSTHYFVVVVVVVVVVVIVVGVGVVRNLQQNVVFTYFFDAFLQRYSLSTTFCTFCNCPQFSAVFNSRVRSERSFRLFFTCKFLTNLPPSSLTCEHLCN